MVNLSQKPLMLSEIFLTTESISELGNFYGVVSIDMSPDEIWNTGSVWLVWRETCQTDGVLLMMWADYTSHIITYHPHHVTTNTDHTVHTLHHY